MATLADASDVSRTERAWPRAASLSAEVHDSFAAVEGVWRALEREGVATPYQRLDFVRAFVEPMAEAGAFRPRFVVLSDACGRPRALLPLALRRAGPFRLASFVGGKHANFHLPLFAPEAALPDAGELRRILRRIGRTSLGIDAFLFSRQPVAWEGRLNPLAEGGRPSPSNAYRLTLDPDPARTIDRAFSRDARKKLRYKEKKLAETGAVCHRIARSEAEVDAFLAAFYAHKAVRFRELGIPNLFQDAAVRAFLRGAALTGLERGEPALELHALTVGERIAAVFGAVADRQRASGMVISFDGDPALARYSPGDVLLRGVIEGQCRAGRQIFDLGVGEARYKGICDEVEELVDTVIPLTWRGRIVAGAAVALARAKRWTKRTPWAWRLATDLRAKAMRLRG